VLSDLQERRTSDCLAAVIDDALDLANECGWRYAIAYLVNERVPSHIIQRLLSEGGRIRRRSSKVRSKNPLAWNGHNGHGMKSLFDWLRQRRSIETGNGDQTKDDSRFSEHPDEIG